MGHFVENQGVEFEIRSLVHKTAILSAYTEISRDIKIDAAAINKCRLRLPIDAIDQEFVRRIEDQSACARQGVGTNIGNFERDVKDK